MLRKPRTRGECSDVPRPCPFVSCKYHLYLDVNPATGTIKYNHPNIPPDLMSESCALDVADNEIPEHGNNRLDASLVQIAKHTGLTKQRVQQIEKSALAKLQEIQKKTEPF